MSVKSNERELAGQIQSWFQAEIARNTYPFKECTSEAGIQTDTTTRFGDIILWEDRIAQKAFTLIELKPPHGNIENIETFAQKASALHLKYAYTWDLCNLNVYEINNGVATLLGSEPTPVLDNINDWLRGDKQATIKGYINRFCSEFVKLHETGKFTKFNPDKIYFIELIRAIVEQLKPTFINFLNEKLGNPITKAKINEYVVKQGITFANEEDFLLLIASQRVYGLVTKIIFYLTIRRYFNDLPELEPQHGDLNISLKNAFAAAREKDWQAVFENGTIDDLGIPDASYDTFFRFFAELKVYHFEALPEDVVGELFQEIIDPDQRHTLGQYFTSENLVDFVIALVVKDPNGIYSDPTCGSGTFLIRLYDRLKYLNPAKTHRDLLDQIWGFDIGSFPAELSTINLFRQDASNFENFPKVRTINIFDVQRGMNFDFPPPNAGQNYFKVQQTLPEINAFVGNFPFIRQELIEKKDKGFKDYLTILLAKEYLYTYPQLFHLKNGLKNGSQSKDNDQAYYTNINNIKKWVKEGHLELKLSGQADMYAYIYIHLTTLLAQDGEFAIITSNSWLDVSYGAVLKQFFLDHFCIKTIVASWAEPWFDDASVNCIITVLKREADAEKRNNNITNFVKLKKTFAELVPHGHELFERNERWKALDYLERLISSAQFHEDKHKNITVVNAEIRTFENELLRNRMLKQSALQTEVSQKVENSKWGKYIRAPDVYFKLNDLLTEKLLPLNEVGKIRRGYTTGINDFFYLQFVSESENSTKWIVKNEVGWQGEIEIEYLKKVIKSPKESEAIIIDEKKLPNLIFICDKSTDELVHLNHFGAYYYIDWAENKYTKGGVKWTNVSSVTGRKLWYQIKEKEPSSILLQMIGSDRFMAFLNKTKVHADHNLFEYEIDNPELINQSEIFLNSTLFALIKEVNSRSNLGDGATKTEGVDWSNLMLIPKEKINIKFKSDKIFKRKILPIQKEIKQKDRQELDSAVLEALGLNPKEYLQAIYDGLVEMVNERLELPKLRKKKKIQKVATAYNDVKKSVIKDCLPYGFRHFPQSFYHNTDSIAVENIPTSGNALRIREYFLGKYIIVDSQNQLITNTESQANADFIVLFSKLNLNTYQIPIPKDENVVIEVLKTYNKYITELKEQLRVNAHTKLHNWSLAEKMAEEILNMNFS
ncbi:MAG: N-6 DNA methylase [Cytophagales bacterium]|nr:N-6 DNA methylase [Cytophagales bacterium]